MDRAADVLSLGVLGILLLPFLPFLILFAVGDVFLGRGGWKVVTFITLSIALYVLYYVLLKHHILFGT